MLVTNWRNGQYFIHIYMKSVPYLMEAFAEVLKDKRELRSLTQRQMADAMGSVRSLVSFLENGKNMPSLQTFFVIAETLEISPAELLNDVMVTMERMRGRKKNPL